MKLLGLILGGIVSFTLVPFAAAQPIKIVAIGDSNFDVPGIARSDMYPALLETALRARGYDVTVTNAGRRGDSSMKVHQRLDSDVPDGTDVALVSVGANDPFYYGISVEQSKENVRRIVSRLQARGITTINLLTGKRFQRSVAENPKYHVETFHKAGTTEWHLNAAGNAVVVRETISQVIKAIESAKKQKKSVGNAQR